MCVTSFHLFAPHDHSEMDQLQASWLRFIGDKASAQLWPFRAFSAWHVRRGLQPSRWETHPRRERHWERHHWALLFLGLRLCWTFVCGYCSVTDSSIMSTGHRSGAAICTFLPVMMGLRFSVACCYNTHQQLPSSVCQSGLPRKTFVFVCVFCGRFYVL